MDYFQVPRTPIIWILVASVLHIHIYIWKIYIFRLVKLTNLLSFGLLFWTYNLYNFVMFKIGVLYDLVCQELYNKKKGDRTKKRKSKRLRLLLE